jgi:hypothetical protein
MKIPAALEKPRAVRSAGGNNMFKITGHSAGATRPLGVGTQPQVDQRTWESSERLPLVELAQSLSKVFSGRAATLAKPDISFIAPLLRLPNPIAFQRAHSKAWI